MKHVTLYVATDGGDFEILLQQTTDSSTIFNGLAGESYEFLALATDNAGNRELPDFGIFVPDDGSSVNLGTLTNVGRTAAPDLGLPQPPSGTPAVNELFIEAQAGIPSALPTADVPVFQAVLRPFSGEAFATGIAESHADVGPMATVELADGSVLASGGLGRNQLFRFSRDGGAAASPIATLSHPIFDLALGDDGRLWAATGGGPLLELDPETGAILAEHGDGLTQSVEIDPQSGKIYVSSGHGIEIFDPGTQTFEHFSDMRVGSLAFAPTGELWAASWHQRGDVVRFDGDDPELMLQFDTPVDSLAFGLSGTVLEGLLFITNNAGTGDEDGSELTMVDLATLRQVAVATGGSRGDIVTTTSLGSVLVSQTEQIDLLRPVTAPRVTVVNPPPDALVALPRSSIVIGFDQGMFVGDPDDSASVVNPENYALTGDQSGDVPILFVQYDPQTNSALLEFEAIPTDEYTITARSRIRSAAGQELDEQFTSRFTAISDFAALVDLDFSDARSNRETGTVSYDVLITNTTDNDFVLPFYMRIDQTAGFVGGPVEGVIFSAEGSWLLDLSDVLPGGVLGAGESTAVRTISFTNPENQRADFDEGIFTQAADNLAPRFVSVPITTATVGLDYEYRAIANDLDGLGISYFLYTGPEGMTVESETGFVTWQPDADSPADATVILLAYDSRGGVARQTFSIDVDGGNHAPVLSPLPGFVHGREGELIEITYTTNDPDGDPLFVWTENLPPGAFFDPDERRLTWTPGPQSAGTYDNFRVIVSDGRRRVVQTTTLLIAPGNHAPTLALPETVTVREGDMLRLAIQTDDPDGDAVRFFSPLLPPGARLDPQTGVFEWIPDFFQHGIFDVPVTATDGESFVTQTIRIQVLDANGTPEFVSAGEFQIQEGQQFEFRIFAADPDNPNYVPPDRLADGTLTLQEGTLPTVTYTIENLPAGATYDDETQIVAWIPGFDDAGFHQFTATATDDGGGTGIPASSSFTVSLTVLNTNRPPEIASIDNQVVSRGDVLQFNVTAADPDGNQVTFSAAGLPGFPIPDFATFTDLGNGSGTFRFEPGFGDRGDHSITLTAVDNGDGDPTDVQTDTFTFIVTVESPNEPPRLAPIGPKVAVVGEELSFVVNVADLDEDDLTFVLTGTLAGATITPSVVYGRATVRWTPTAVGPHTGTVTVTDSGNGNPADELSDQQTFDILVRNSNNAPILSPVGNQELTEGETLDLQLDAFDADSDILTYTAANLPPGAVLDRTTGLFSWTPGRFLAGVYPGIELTVSDGHSESTETITITVNNSNEPPTVTPLPVQSARENVLIQFTVATNDIDGDSLVLTTQNLPAGAMLDPNTGEFRWTPGFEQQGRHVISVTATDPGGLTGTVDLTIDVSNVNRPPTLDVSSHSAALVAYQ